MILVAILITMIVLTGRRPSPTYAFPVLQTLAVVGGQPDDITTDRHGRLVWGDLARGTVQRLDGARIVTLARGLSVPEGVVVLHNGAIIVAEQGNDSIVRIDKHGVSTVLVRLRPVAGQEGVDGIGLSPRAVLIPDSPRGTLLSMNLRTGRVRLVARGMGRPVDAAVDPQGDVLVPDEHLGTLVVVSPRGKVAYRGTFATPDDVAIAASGKVWVTTLGDGGLWEMAPGAAPQRVLAGLANPQGLTLDKCGDPIVVEQNTSRIVRVLLTAGSERCRL